MTIIELKNIIGLFTNADQEDIKEEFSTVLQNYYPTNGKLVKTFGIGVKIATALGSTCQGLVTFFNSELATPDGSGTGYVYIAILVNNETNVVTIKFWDGDSWETGGSTKLFENALGTYYHDYDRNPVIQERGILRLLPGNLGVVGANQCEGIWMGWIDRDYFDQIYIADTDFNSAFYSESTLIEAPDISEVTATVLQGGTWTTDEDGDDTLDSDEVEPPKYYKMSNIYDGVQESLLSDPIRVTLDLTFDLYVKLEFDITESTHNKRITGRKIYRSDYPTGSYGLIHTIDFLRDSDDLESSASGGHSGNNTAYVPSLVDYDFDNAFVYVLYTREGSGYWGLTIKDVDGNALDGTGHTIFRCTTDSGFLNTWNGAWYLTEAGSTVEQGYTGAYCGKNVIIVEDDIGVGNAAGGVVYLADVESGLATTGAASAGDGKQVEFTDALHDLAANDIVLLSGFSVNTNYNGVFVVQETTANTFTVNALWGSDENGEYQAIGNERIVADNFEKAILVVIGSSYTAGHNKAFCNDGAGAPLTCNDKAWILMKPHKGLYKTTDNGGSVTYEFYDTNLTEGAAHPLESEVSINVNGKFAIIHKNRLWQLRVVLDPGGKSESHGDWLTYSELDQYDVNPVSNAIPIIDLTNGKGTGLGISFGSLIIAKEFSVHKLLINDPSDPTSWVLSDSVYNRGNLAEKGFIQVGNLCYICSSDGIYVLDINFQAATDDTPLIQDRISEPINDVYLAVADKTAIISGYDKLKSEIIYAFTSSSVWAYSIVTKQWREIDTDSAPAMFAYDENNDLMAFNSTDYKIYAVDDDESVGCSVATKFFNVSGGEGGREGLVRSVSIRYKSAVALIVRCYLNGSTDVAVESELAPALTQANWDTTAGWDLSGSTLNHSSDGAGTISPLTDLSIIAGQVYKVVITLSAVTVGNCTYTIGGTSGTTLSSATTYTDYVIASTTGDLIFTPSAAGARFTISAVSVKQITGGSLAISSSPDTVKMAIRRRCHSFKIEIVDLTESTSDTEIFNIKIETDS